LPQRQARGFYADGCEPEACAVAFSKPSTPDVRWTRPQLLALRDITRYDAPGSSFKFPDNSVIDKDDYIDGAGSKINRILERKGTQITVVQDQSCEQLTVIDKEYDKK
jgi:hypothetical protein